MNKVYVGFLGIVDQNSFKRLKSIHAFFVNSLKAAGLQLLRIFSFFLAFFLFFSLKAAGLQLLRIFSVFLAFFRFFP